MYESKVHKIGLSCDAFSTGCLVMCLLFFVPYVSAVDTTIMWVMPVLCILPFAVMPLVYMVIHRFDTLLFGRYHFVMPLSAFLCAPFFVIAWSANGAGMAQTYAVFFGMLVFALTVMIYRYCAFSVRARLSDMGIVDKYPLYELFCALGSIAACGAFAGFLHYNSQTVYVNTAYVMGGATVLFALIQYLITFYDIPRLGGRRVEGVKSVFKSFYGGIDVKLYLSALLFEAAFAVNAALIVYFAFALGVDIYGVMAIVATVIVAYGISACFCARIIVRRSVFLSVINIIYIVLSCGTLALLAALNKSGSGTFAGLIIVAVIVGLGGAVAVRQTKLRLLTVKPRVTTGTVFILSELTMFAAVGIALLAAAVVVAVLQSTMSVTAFIYGFAIAVVLALLAMLLRVFPKKRKPAALDTAESSADNATYASATYAPATDISRTQSTKE